jgi:transcriptional regulator with XRE-family HTH domain
MENLRLLRESYRMSQQKLAEQFDLAQSQIQSYETGAYEPDIATLGKLADYFNTSIDYLVGRTEIRRKIEPAEEYLLNGEEKALVDTFRGIAPNQRKSLSMFVETLTGK